MDLTGITSAANPICKRLISLRQRKHRRENRQLVLEGLRGVKDAVEAGWMPELVMVSHHFEDMKGARALMAQLETMEVQGYMVPDELMNKLSDTETPQGIMAVFPQPEVFLEKLLKQERGFWLVLDRIQDPGNLGTLIRSGEAAGVSGVFLTHGTTDPYSPKALRASTGAVLHLPVAELSAADSDCFFLRKEGIHLVGAALEGGTPYYQTHFRLPLALVIGNEANGIAEDLLDLVQQRVTIPMKGSLQSINAAIAGSVLLFHLSRELAV